MSRIASRLAFLILLALALPACARPTPGGPAGSSASGRVVVSGQSFSDTTIAGLVARLSKEGTPLVLELEQCTFTKRLSFTGAGTEFSSFGINCTFKDCTFEQELSADYTQFAGKLTLYKCRFKKRVSMQNCTFMAPAGFKSCGFDQPAAFTNSVFMREASFMDTHFFDLARLQGCRFMAPVQFGNAIFHDMADLTLARFDEGAWFDYATFMGRADLGNARALGPVTFRAGSAKQIVLTNLTAYDKVSILNMKLTDTTQVRGAVFMRGRP